MRRTFSLLLAGALVTGVGAAGYAAATGDIRRASVDDTTHTEASGASQAPAQTVVSALARSIIATQSHLRAQPKDAAGWAGLALAYVNQARLTADPTLYPKADAAIRSSLTAQPAANFNALGASGALKAARHDFTGALADADRALALNAYSAQAINVRTDALVELGRYDEAQRSAEHADDVHSGAPTVTRLSYLAELHGNLPEAKRLMQLGVDDAGDPSDVAFAETQLGALDRASGDLAGARRHVSAALQAEPTYLPARAAQADLAAAEGHTAEALTAYADITGRLPLAQYLLAYGELLEATGHSDEAKQQWDVLRASVTLAKANGVYADIDLAHFEADHGSPAQAVVAAQSEWSRRHSILAADALGWALHSAGRDREALPLVRAATRLGTHDAKLIYHRGMVELALGDKKAAARSLSAALRIDPSFSPMGAPLAKRALASLSTEGSS